MSVSRRGIFKPNTVVACPASDLCYDVFQALRARREERSGRADTDRAGRSSAEGGEHQHERKEQQESQLLHHQGEPFDPRDERATGYEGKPAMS